MHNSIAQPPTAVLELKREVDNNTAQLRQLAVTLPVEIAIAQTVNTQHFDALTFAEIAINIARFAKPHTLCFISHIIHKPWFLSLLHRARLQLPQPARFE